MNLAQRIQDYRARRLYARRLARVLDYLERRALRRVRDMDVCFTTLKDWSERHDCSINQAAVRRVQMRAAVMLALLLLCHIAAAQNVALLPPPLPPVPKGETFTLAWDASPSPGLEYRIYASTNRTDWRRVASTTNLTVTVSNVIMPTWWVARAGTSNAESADSNRIGWLTNYQVLTVTAQASSNLTSWATIGPITVRTNPTGQTFFRTAAQLKTFKKFE